MNTKLILLIGILTLLSSKSSTQILHTESFSVIIDTSKKIKGNFLPNFKFQNLKEDLIEFENTSDLTFRFKKNAITVANKFELSKYGKTVLLSGGFLYVEYRRIMENKFVLEPFSQIHWSEARGLQFKYSGGLNLRYKIHSSTKLGFYAGIGPFYELEHWNYDGVPDHLKPSNTSLIKKDNFKIGSYISLKWNANDLFDVDLSLYHQSRFDEMFSTPRLASSSSISYNFTEHLGLILRYQNIYDFDPPVPIEKLYNEVVFSIEVSF
jgi:hypothetical protein